MKWAERIGIVNSSLLVFLVSILLSYHYKDKDWLPEFLMMIAGAALSIVIVLKIVEVWSKKERNQRWEKVKLLIYLRMRHILVAIALYFCTYIAIVQDIYPSIYRPQNKLILLNSVILFASEPDKIITNMKTLANDIKFMRSTASSAFLKDKQLIKDKNNVIRYKSGAVVLDFPSKIEQTEQDIKYNLLKKSIKLEEISDIIKRFENLTPRALELSDDEELGLILQKLEESCRLLLYFNPRTYFELGYITQLDAFSKFLKLTADLFELMQKTNVTKPKKNWINEIKKKLKYWWLPPAFWE